MTASDPRRLTSTDPGSPVAHSDRRWRAGDLELLIALAKGSTRRDAARSAGVSERTAYRRPGALGVQHPTPRPASNKHRHRLKKRPARTPSRHRAGTPTRGRGKTHQHGTHPPRRRHAAVAAPIEPIARR